MIAAANPRAWALALLILWGSAASAAAVWQAIRAANAIGKLSAAETGLDTAHRTNKTAAETVDKLGASLSECAGQFAAVERSAAADRILFEDQLAAIRARAEDHQNAARDAIDNDPDLAACGDLPLPGALSDGLLAAYLRATGAGRDPDAGLDPGP